MTNERIEGTILVDRGPLSFSSLGAYAATTLPGNIEVQVGFDGLIEYATCGDYPDRLLWVAGYGPIRPVAEVG